MAIESKNCCLCGVELSAANSFICRRCGRNDVCILHRGLSSGLCSICLARLRRRLVWPIFILIALVMVVFSPVMFKHFPSPLVFLMVLYLSFWIFLESTKPAVTKKNLRVFALNALGIMLLFLFLLISGWNLASRQGQIDVPRGLTMAIFLFTGTLLFCLGFLFLFSLSMRNFGVSLFDYDYPEEYSVLLKYAGRDPEKASVIRWDVRWITSTSFIFGILFLYVFAVISFK